MKSLLLAFSMLTLLAIVACQKNDSGGGGGAVGCQPGYIAAPAFPGACQPQDQCPYGLVKNPSQRSMCANPQTGVNVMPLQCGTGYVLTIEGCLPPCPNGQGGLYANSCIAAVSGSQYQQYPNQQQQYGPMYGGGYYGQTAYPNYYYRGYY